jgi:hypothetical protein
MPPLPRQPFWTAHRRSRIGLFPSDRHSRAREWTNVSPQHLQLWVWWEFKIFRVLMLLCSECLLSVLARALVNEQADMPGSA